MQDDKGFLTRQDDLPQESCRISREINAAWWKKACQTAFCRCSDIPKGAFKKKTVPVPQRHKDGVAISRLAALGRTYESLPSPAVFGTHLILYSRDQQKSTLKYTFSVKSLPLIPHPQVSGNGARENLWFSRFLHQRRKKKFQSFSPRRVRGENTKTRAPLGRIHQSADWWGI